MLRCSRCAHAVLPPYQLGFATAAAIRYGHILRGAAALLGAVPRTARRARVVLCAAILPARCVLGMAALRCTSVHGLAAIDRGAVIAAGASVWGISFRFGDSGVAAIREGASVSAAIIRTATATAILQLGYSIRRQGGIDIIGRVLGNATQRSGRMREAPQKGGISVSPGGLGHCADGRLLRATLARQADRRVLALADHTFTLERACDAGIGAARGLKRRLSMHALEATLAAKELPNVARRVGACVLEYRGAARNWLSAGTSCAVSLLPLRGLVATAASPAQWRLHASPRCS